MKAYVRGERDAEEVGSADEGLRLHRCARTSVNRCSLLHWHLKLPSAVGGKGPRTCDREALEKAPMIRGASLPAEEESPTIPQKIVRPTRDDERIRHERDADKPGQHAMICSCEIACQALPTATSSSFKRAELPHESVVVTLCVHLSPSDG